MESRIQTALVKQLRRQMHHSNRADKETFHTTIRHLAQRRRLVDEHFAQREYNIVAMFGAYNHRVKNILDVNKTRFDLCVQEQVDTIVEKHSHVSTYEKPVYVSFDSLDTQFENSHSNTDFYALSWGVTLMILFAMRG
jgi:hypothetical protein